MITLISTPAVADTTDPTFLYRWVATESPINFRLFRSDWVVTNEANSGGYLAITLSMIGAFPGTAGDSISVYNSYNDTMYTGVITSTAGDPVIVTDIVWEATMVITYANDNTLYGGYYFEARLTINGAVEPLTVIASPDSFGYADVDVAGILRIHTSLGKTGDYTTLVMAEPTKSGNFSVEYRGCWYGSSEAWTDADDDLITSPAAATTWYYAECVRSEEQGTNLHEYVASAFQDAPYLNLFDQPVLFVGLPWDISFILPELNTTGVATDMTVSIRFYNSANAPVGAVLNYTVDVDALTLDGHVCSLTIDQTLIPIGATYFTSEITA